MSQVTAPIIAITLVLLSVFVPTAFIPGITGQLYQQFAVAVSVSMLISAMNALSLSPALCAILLRQRGHRRGLIAYFERGFVEAQQAAYDETALEDKEICERLDRGRRALWEQGLDDAGPYQSPMEDAEVHFHEWLHRKLGI